MDDNFLLEDDAPFGVQGDPTVQETNYKSWEDGEYEATGIHSFITKDKDRDDPLFVPQGDKSVTRFKLTLIQKDPSTQDSIEVEGPPMSATAAEMRMLVRAFGGDINKLPAEPTSKFLLDAKEECNKSKKRVKCGVKGGWVKWVAGMNPPIGKELFTWKFKGFWNKDNPTPISFVNDAFGNSVVQAKFEIVADGWGNPSPYAGYEISTPVYNPFTGSYVEINGHLRPATVVGEKGGVPTNVKRFLTFVSLFCSPDFAHHEWQGDLEKSEFGINEFENPLPVVAKYMKNSGKLACAALSEKSKGVRKGDPKLALEDLVPYKGQQVVDLDQRKVEETKQPGELELFVRAADKIAGFSVFKPTPANSNEINLEFTDQGKEWAVKTLAPMWDKLELPMVGNRRQIGTLDKDQLKTLTERLLNSDATGGVDSF